MHLRLLDLPLLVAEGLHMERIKLLEGFDGDLGLVGAEYIVNVLVIFELQLEVLHNFVRAVDS